MWERLNSNYEPSMQYQDALQLFYNSTNNECSFSPVFNIKQLPYYVKLMKQNQLIDINESFQFLNNSKLPEDKKHLFSSIANQIISDTLEVYSTQNEIYLLNHVEYQTFKQRFQAMLNANHDQLILNNNLHQQNNDQSIQPCTLKLNERDIKIRLQDQIQMQNLTVDSADDNIAGHNKKLKPKISGIKNSQNQIIKPILTQIKQSEHFEQFIQVFSPKPDYQCNMYKKYFQPFQNKDQQYFSTKAIMESFSKYFKDNFNGQKIEFSTKIKQQNNQQAVQTIFTIDKKIVMEALDKNKAIGKEKICKYIMFKFFPQIDPDKKESNLIEQGEVTKNNNFAMHEGKNKQEKFQYKATSQKHLQFDVGNKHYRNRIQYPKCTQETNINQNQNKKSQKANEKYQRKAFVNQKQFQIIHQNQSSSSFSNNCNQQHNNNKNHALSKRQLIHSENIQSTQTQQQLIQIQKQAAFYNLLEQIDLKIMNLKEKQYQFQNIEAMNINERSMTLAAKILKQMISHFKLEDNQKETIEQLKDRLIKSRQATYFQLNSIFYLVLVLHCKYQQLDILEKEGGSYTIQEDREYKDENGKSCKQQIIQFTLILKEGADANSKHETFQASSYNKQTSVFNTMFKIIQQKITKNSQNGSPNLYKIYKSQIKQYEKLTTEKLDGNYIDDQQQIQQSQQQLVSECNINPARKQEISQQTSQGLVKDSHISVKEPSYSLKSQYLQNNLEQLGHIGSVNALSSLVQIQKNANGDELKKESVPFDQIRHFIERIDKKINDTYNNGEFQSKQNRQLVNFNDI